MSRRQRFVSAVKHRSLELNEIQNVYVQLTYQLSNPVKYKVNLILSDSVVSASIVVSGILFAGYQLLRVKQTAVCTGADFICAGVEPSTQSIHKRNEPTLISSTHTET